MTINLITPEQYEFLKDMQEKYSSLTFQNVGYQYIDLRKLSEDDKQALKQIGTILRKAIVGFREFNNFCHNENNELRVRFQYNYNADIENRGVPFTGVGYLYLDELLNGFRQKELLNTKS